MDLTLFLGRKFVPAAAESASDGEMYIGAMPGIEEEMETVERVLQKDSELQMLEKSMTGAYKLYYKNRSSASKVSVKRSKEFVQEVGGLTNLSTRFHPYFGGRSDTQEFVEGLRKFKPQVEDADRVLPLTVVKTMAQQQSQHELVKQLTNEALSKKTAEDAEGSDSEYEDAGLTRKAKAAPSVVKNITKPRISKRARMKGAVAEAKESKVDNDTSVFERTTFRSEDQYLPTEMDRADPKESGLELEKFR